MPNIDEMIRNFENGQNLVPCEIDLKEKDISVWVRFKVDPSRFSSKIFDGDWAFTNQHPTAGNIRIIKAITGNDGISRLIARQGRYIYAYPWFK